MPTHPSASAGQPTPRTLQDEIQRDYEQVRDFINRQAGDRLRALWPNWDRRFRDLFDRSIQRPQTNLPTSMVAASVRPIRIGGLIAAGLIEQMGRRKLPPRKGRQRK